MSDTGARRLGQVDLLKGVAIAGVVLLHSLSYAQQMATQTAFHISQAVPVFSS